MNEQHIVRRLCEIVQLQSAGSSRVSASENAVALEIWQLIQQKIEESNRNSEVVAMEHDYAHEIAGTSTSISESEPHQNAIENLEMISETCLSSSEDENENEYCDNFQPNEPSKIDGHTYSFEKMKEIVNFYAPVGKPKRSFKVVKNRYKQIKHWKTLSRIVEVVNKGGMFSEQLKVINDYVWHKFEEASGNNPNRDFLPVHDNDLQNWAREKGRKLGIIFKAGKTWLTNFKKKHNIVSRKVTDLVTSRQTRSAEEIAQSAEAFRDEYREVSLHYPLYQQFNSDQTGYNYEMTSRRTLSIRGKKRIFLHVKSKHNITHSATKQVLIDASGRLRGKVYLCLQEPKGRMGPRIKRTYFKPKNMEVTCSSSGKLTSSLFKRWVNRVFYPEAKGEPSLILLDSWRGQHDDAQFEVFKPHEACQRLKIPEGTTPVCQPLDVFWFRHDKSIGRKFYNFVQLHGLAINLGERNNFIRMHSLIHNQMMSDKFTEIGQLAWYLAKLRDEKPDNYVPNAMEILFPADMGPCSSQNCTRVPFIRCSHCDLDLCFRHFFTLYHTHN